MVSASSVMGLKAELHAARQRAKGEEAPQKRRRTQLRWADAPKDANRGGEHHAEDRALETSRAALERKARAYAKLQHGKQGGIETDGLVDWDMKDEEEEEQEEGEEEPEADDPNDPLVEYEDEFGRTRMVRQSDLPRHTPHVPDEPYDNAVYGPATSFPVFHNTPRTLPIPERRATPEPEHFDADWDIRARGAAFYKFDANEEVRRTQQRDLQALRHETEAKRAERPQRPIQRTTLGAARRAARQRYVDAQREQVR